MRFELTEPNKQFSTSELIEDLTRISCLLGKSSISISEYKNLGNYSYQTLKKRFGSWETALGAASLVTGKRSWGGDLSETKIPEEKLLADMLAVSAKLEGISMKISDYDLHGIYGSATICKRFGGWNKAKEIAGLKIGRQYNSTEEDYFENILSVWKSLGRQPLYREMVSPLSKLDISSYERVFGTWRSALERFIEYTNTKDITNEAKFEVISKPSILQQSTTVKIKNKKASAKRTNRTANLRQRYKILKRDNFTCVLCGVSPANNSGCELQIDHIIPWSHGGETVEENLRTLCSQCNLGRSNKE